MGAWPCRCRDSLTGAWDDLRRGTLLDISYAPRLPAYRQLGSRPVAFARGRNRDRPDHRRDWSPMDRGGGQEPQGPTPGYARFGRESSAASGAVAGPTGRSRPGRAKRPRMRCALLGGRRRSGFGPRRAALCVRRAAGEGSRACWSAVSGSVTQKLPRNPVGQRVGRWVCASDHDLRRTVRSGKPQVRGMVAPLRGRSSIGRAPPLQGGG